MKKYPCYSEFPPEEIIYGCHAPLVGMGIYTFCQKFSWPDRQCTMKFEYEAWAKHLTENGYEIPAEYLNAYAEFESEQALSGAGKGE